MPSKLKHQCCKIGCPNITTSRYCDIHTESETKKEQQHYDRQRGSAKERGYDYRWFKGSKYFRDQQGNHFCYIQGPNCKGLSECKEHIIPPSSKDDPLFDDPNNHGPACIPCNSWKGHRSIQQLVENEKKYFERTRHDPIGYLRRIGKLVQ